MALVFTALLGLARAWVAEREAGALDGLVLAPSDRSAIWLGKSLATLAFLFAAELVALPAFVVFFAPLDAAALAGVVLASIGICTVGSLVSAMAAAAGRRCSCRSSSSRCDPPRRRAAGAGIAAEPGTYSRSSSLYDAVFAILSWAAFEYVVTE